MNTQSFLFHYGHYVAYASVWLIHGFYLTTLVRRFDRVKKELKELGSAADLH